jgi:hypothetical protein
MYFEYFKHLTTLNVATALVLLTIYREIGVGAIALGVVLTLLVISLIGSGYALLLIPIGAGANPKRLVRFVRYVVGLLYLGGVGAFTIEVLST